VAEPDVDRNAYLQEQIERQKRGEPIDVAWVRAELERVRLQQATHAARTQRSLRWLTGVSGALLLVLWLRNGAFDQRNGALWLGGILVAALAAWAISRRRR
jgi:hypothetical protein